MKKAHKIAIAALFLCLLVLYLVVPQKAVRGGIPAQQSGKNGLDITGRLTEETLAQIKELAENAECTRWKNSIGAYPVYEDTVAIFGEDDRGRCIFTLAGGANKYGVEDHMIRDGEELWKTILEILP